MNKTRIMLLVFYMILTLFSTALAGRRPNSELQQCRDDNNKPVDWYVLYKLPKVAQSSNPLLKQGVAYLYITSDTIKKGWQLSNWDIRGQNSTPANTLAPLYDDETSNNKMWVLYSDNPPNGQANGKYGHAKGVVLADRLEGFWLIHSVPNFPPVPNGGESRPKRNSRANSTLANDVDSITAGLAALSISEGEYDYPSSGQNYGQSFLCISLKGDQFDVIAKQLMYNQIIVYRRNLPDALVKLYPTLADAMNQVRIKQAPYMNKAVIRSRNSVEFTSFAKSDKWQKDLYDDFVAPQLETDLLTETWLNGRGKLPSDCTGAKVYNIESIQLGQPVNVSFKSSQDHSKWAVALDDKSNSSWVCVGDINRADTQYNRGGGTVCLNSEYVWNNYRSSINEIEPCPRKQYSYSNAIYNSAILV